MPACLFVLYWPDCADPETSGPPPAPALVGAALRRQLPLRYGRYAAYVWAPSEEGPVPHSEAFRRWGLTPLDREPHPQRLGELAREHPSARRVVLAMHPERALEALPLLNGLGREVEVWSPHAASNSLPGAARVAALEEALLLKTAHPVGVFADWRLLEETMRRLGAAPEPEAAVGGLLRAAGLVGTVVTARVAGLGPGPALEAAPALPPSLKAPGLHSSEALEALRQELCAALEDAHGPRTWIIAADAPWLPCILRGAHERGVRVLLWAAETELLPAEVRAAADGCADLPAVLQPEETPPISGGRRDIRVLSTSIRQSTAPGEDPAARQPDSSAPLPGALREGWREPGSPTGASAACLGPWVRLVYHTECILRSSGAGRISFRILAAGLAELEEFGPTAANATMWLNRARAEGMLFVDAEPVRGDATPRTPTCRPNGEHPISRAALEVPDRCLRLLHQMLQKMPWVSFKLLRSVLLREQWLGGPPYRLDEAGVDEWLNFLIQDGAISMSKEPNLVNPDYPVTALRLNDSHPLSRAVTAECAEGTRLAAERAILAVDHFLTRNRKPWMSISALRRALDSIGREELQEVLQGLQSLGALVTESYPNPQKEHPTTGCRLHPEVPVVSEALRTRNAIIRAAQNHQRFRAWVPLARLDAELRAAQPGTPDNYRTAWYLLLRDEGILELDHPELPEDAWGEVRCRLNVSDAVVRAVVAQSSAGGGPGTAEPTT